MRTVFRPFFLWLLATLVVWGGYFSLLWPRMFFVDAAGNMIAGNANLWADWAAHLTITTSLWQRGLLIGNPFLIGTPLTYPFLVDALSAALLAVGVHVAPAMAIPSWLISVVGSGMLFTFYATLFTLKNSKKDVIHNALAKNSAVQRAPFLAAFLATGFWFCSGSFDSAGTTWHTLVSNILIPERAFSLGWVVLLGLLIAVMRSRRRWQWIVIGLALGLLPVIHTHAFLAAFVILAGWAMVDVLRRKDGVIKWFLLAASAALTATPLVLRQLAEINNHFLSLQAGWLAPSLQLSWFLFWWQNASWLLIAGGAGWLIAWRHNRELAKLAVPFGLLFILLNLISFQPFLWDNAKILAWAMLGFAGAAGWGIAWCWAALRQHTSLWKRAVGIGCLIGVTFAITFPGLKQNWQLFSQASLTNQMYNAEELQLADWVLAHTPRDSIWLTSDQHNHWLYNLTGRQTLLAYRGWLWTYGVNYLPVESDVSLMFLGSPIAPELLHKYHVSYVVIGNSERTVWYANGAFFARIGTVVKQSGFTTIYAIPENLNTAILPATFGVPSLPAPTP